MTVIKPRLTFRAHNGATVGQFPFRHAAVRTSERAWARSYRLRLLVTDTIIIIAFCFGSMFLRFGFDDTHAFVGGYRTDYFVIAVVIAVVWMLTLAAYHTRDSRVVGIGVTEYRRVVSSSSITFGLLAIVFLVAKVDIARSYFVLALPVGVLGVLTQQVAVAQMADPPAHVRPLSLTGAGRRRSGRRRLRRASDRSEVRRCLPRRRCLAG